MKQSVAVLCIPALRKFLSADGVLAARDAGTLNPQTGQHRAEHCGNAVKV